MRRSTINASPAYIRKIINEEVELFDTHQNMKRFLIAESERMRGEGYGDQERINEIFGWLTDLLDTGPGAAFIETFKSDIAVWLGEKLGMDPEGFLFRAIENVVENAKWSEIGSYFTTGGCDKFANLVMDALFETGVEPLVDGFVSSLGVDKDGRIYRSLREWLTNSLTAGEMGMAIKGKISEMVCGLDIAEVAKDMTGIGGDSGAASPGGEEENGVISSLVSKGLSAINPFD